MGDPVAERIDVAFESVVFDPCLGILVNLLVTLGEPGDEALGNRVDFEATEVVVDLIAEGSGGPWRVRAGSTPGRIGPPGTWPPPGGPSNGPSWGSKVALKTTQWVCRCGSSSRLVSWRKKAPTRFPVMRSSFLPALRTRVSESFSSSVIANGRPGCAVRRCGDPGTGRQWRRSSEG